MQNKQRMCALLSAYSVSIIVITACSAENVPAGDQGQPALPFGFNSTAGPPPVAIMPARLEKCPGGVTAPFSSIQSAAINDGALELHYSGACGIRVCWDGSFREQETPLIQLWATEDSDASACDANAEPERLFVVSLDDPLDGVRISYPGASEMEVAIQGLPQRLRASTK